jgi:tetratricopeptide (TPR) repeat protein
MEALSSSAPSSRWQGVWQYQDGLAAYEAGRLSEAVSTLTRIADREDLMGTLARFYLGQSHLQLGLAELRLGRFQTAEQHLRSAATLNPGAENLSTYLASCLIGQRRYDLAAKEYERQLKIGGDDDQTPVHLALVLWKHGLNEQALEVLHRAARQHPQRADYHFHLGLLYASMDEYEEAAAALRLAVAAAPLDFDARQHLGLILAAVGDWSGAFEHLRVAQRMRPQNAYVALQLSFASRAAGVREGIIAPANGETSDAVERQSDASQPQAAPLHSRPDDRAIECLAEIVLHNPEFVEAFLALPQTGIDPEVFAFLAATLEAALERHPEYADLHYHCSLVYGRLGRTDAAIEAARRALDTNPRFVQALIQLAQLYAETDREQDAIIRLRQAVDRGADYPDVHFLLGRLYRKNGDLARARLAFERALELNRSYSAAREALAELVAA